MKGVLKMTERIENTMVATVLGCIGSEIGPGGRGIVGSSGTG